MSKKPYKEDDWGDPVYGDWDLNISATQAPSAREGEHLWSYRDSTILIKVGENSIDVSVEDMLDIFEGFLLVCEQYEFKEEQ